MRNAVTGIKNDACGTTGSIEGEDGLDGGKKRRDIERFEENLGGGVTV